MKPKSVLDVQLPQIGLFVGLETLNESWTGSSAGYQRQIDTAPPVQNSGPGESEDLAKRKHAKEVHFAFLPKNYVPLEENDSKQRAKEEKKAKRKEKYKKYRKNVGKALRYSWKCLMFGLQNFTVGYSTPLTAATVLVPEFRAGRSKS
ncbi:required for drug-induced death protein 1 [Salminus brasiliensis]|uniref:required for drug-induced death protein 1 n=1 Tax=Salminus brasiliensis TaxID=930266 RepID=UPI003B82EC9A